MRFFIRVLFVGITAAILQNILNVNWTNDTVTMIFMIIALTGVWNLIIPDEER